MLLNVCVAIAMRTLITMANKLAIGDVNYLLHCASQEGFCVFVCRVFACCMCMLVQTVCALFETVCVRHHQ